jgi:hypothetical protein
MKYTKNTKEPVIQEAKELVAQIQAAIAALETETNPEKMLEHVGLIRDQGRINALRSVIRDRALELFDQRIAQG